MEILKLQDVGVHRAARSAAAVLRAGGVIVYPTDTLYGLGADALSDEAVAKIRQIKRRPEKKPIHAIVASLDTAGRYAQVGEEARRLAVAFLPGALTLVLKKAEGVETGIARDIQTFGVRIPDDAFCLELARQFGAPYTTTSANRSGEEPGRSLEMILPSLTESGLIDLVIDGGTLPERLPSTVVDVSGRVPQVLRQGAISSAAIASAL